MPDSKTTGLLEEIGDIKTKGKSGLIKAPIYSVIATCPNCILQMQDIPLIYCKPVAVTTKCRHCNRMIEIEFKE